MNPAQLQRIIDTKERIRQVKRAALAAANASVDRASDALSARMLDRERTAVVIAARGERSAAELSLHAEAAERAAHQVARARDELRSRHAERDARSDDVSQATLDVRTLEVLGARARDLAKRQVKRREQHEQDEVASRKQPKR